MGTICRRGSQRHRTWRKAPAEVEMQTKKAVPFYGNGFFARRHLRTEIDVRAAFDRRAAYSAA